MARYFHGGPNAVDPKVYAAHATDDESREKLESEARKHHPISHPNRSVLKREGDKLKILRPAAFSPIDQLTKKTIPVYDDWEPGSITIGLPDHGYFIIPPGGHVDIDSSVPEKIIKSMAPHLLTEAEAMERGILEPPPVMKKSVAREQRAASEKLTQ